MEAITLHTKSPSVANSGVVDEDTTPTIDSNRSGRQMLELKNILRDGLHKVLREKNSCRRNAIVLEEDSSSKFPRIGFFSKRETER